MRKIELVSWDEVPRRIESAKRSLEIIYGVRLEVESMDVPLDKLHPTEDFLENDKIAFVFMEIVTRGYDVPIIAVKREGDFFVLDGHHRTFISKKICRNSIRANVLKFPERTSYRSVPKRAFEDLPIKDVGIITDPLLKAWSQILTVMKHYEALYNVHFHLRKELVKLSNLCPTQSLVMKKQIDAIRELSVPIVCIEQGDTYYILDGHARSLRAKQLGLKSVDAMVLSPKTLIDFGVVRTAREMGLKTLKDIFVSS